jgi:hypothetical protein
LTGKLHYNATTGLKYPLNFWGIQDLEKFQRLIEIIIEREVQAEKV